MSGLSVHYGAGDILEMLEDVKKNVIAGKIDVLCVTFTGSGQQIGHGTAWVDDTPVPWSRAVAAVSSLQHDLMERGI